MWKIRGGGSKQQACKRHKGNDRLIKKGSKKSKKKKIGCIITKVYGGKREKNKEKSKWRFLVRSYSISEMKFARLHASLHSRRRKSGIVFEMFLAKRNVFEPLSL